MTTIEATQTAAAPAAAVFAVLSDASLLPTVSHMTHEVSGDPGRPLQVGDTFAQKLRILGIPLESDWTVTDVETDRRIVVDGTGPAGVNARIEQAIDEHADGCELRMAVTYEVPAGALGEVVDHLLVEKRSQRDAEAIVANIVELAESRHTAAPR